MLLVSCMSKTSQSNKRCSFYAVESGSEKALPSRLPQVSKSLLSESFHLMLAVSSRRCSSSFCFRVESATVDEFDASNQRLRIRRHFILPLFLPCRQSCRNRSRCFQECQNSQSCCNRSEFHRCWFSCCCRRYALTLFLG